MKTKLCFSNNCLQPLTKLRPNYFKLASSSCIIFHLFFVCKTILRYMILEVLMNLTNNKIIFVNFVFQQMFQLAIQYFIYYKTLCLQTLIFTLKFYLLVHLVLIITFSSWYTWNFQQTSKYLCIKTRYDTLNFRGLVKESIILF